MLFSLKVPAGPEYVSIIRLAISALASRFNFTFEEIEDIKLSVAEACNIAIKQLPPSEELLVEAFLEEKHFRVEVGTFNNALQEIDPLRILEDLGFFLIQSLMDEVSFQQATGRGARIVITKAVSGG